MIDKTESVDHQQLIAKTADFVKNELREAEGGHDWHHIKRVWKNALYIAKKENKGDLLVIELSALLHDIADAKFHNGDESIGPRLAGEFLRSQNVAEDVIRHVIQIVENISFRKRHMAGTCDSVELQIVQDADRLDAIGAIGIARVFNFGGFKNRPLYVPGPGGNGNSTDLTDALTNGHTKEGVKEREGLGTPDNYTRVSSHTIGHFYEKLLLLSDMMNTETGKELALERHNFMLTFLDQFYKEWEGLS